MSISVPDTWPQTRMPNMAAKPNAKLTVRNMPWVPSLKTSWATAPQPNIWRERRKVYARFPIRSSVQNSFMIVSVVRTTLYSQVSCSGTL